jgi:hypothetical protein
VALHCNGAKLVVHSDHPHLVGVDPDILSTGLVFLYLKVGPPPPPCLLASLPVCRENVLLWAHSLPNPLLTLVRIIINSSSSSSAPVSELQLCQGQTLLTSTVDLWCREGKLSSIPLMETVSLTVSWSPPQVACVKVSPLPFCHTCRPSRSAWQEICSS